MEKKLYIVSHHKETVGHIEIFYKNMSFCM